MAAAAVARLASGEIPDHLVNPEVLARKEVAPSCTRPAGPYLLAVDAGTGSCRALLFTVAGEQVAVSLREWTHHEPPGVPGGQDFDVEANWLADRGLHPRRPPAGGRDRGRRRGGERRPACARGSCSTTPAGARSGPARTWTAGPRREAEDLIAEGAAERIFAEAGDWVSITSPARLRWLARHRPDIFGRIHSLGMLSDWIVYRLAGVQVTEPSCGSSSGMFSLASRGWSAADRADLRHLDRRAARRSPTRARRVGEVTARRRGADRPAGRAPRWSPAAPTPSSGCSARAYGPVSSPCWRAPSGRTPCSLDQPAHRPGRQAPDPVPRHAGRVDARGDRVLLRDGDALVPGRLLRRRGRASPAAAAWTRTS